MEEAIVGWVQVENELQLFVPDEDIFQRYHGYLQVHAPQVKVVQNEMSQAWNLLRDT